jgi:hypothetical protein
VTGEPVDLGIPGLDQAVEIGRGGFAVVYRAVQATFRRTVAVKVLSRRNADPASYERFIRECEAMGLLSDHPNIVTVFDAGTTSTGNPYIVMAFVPGGSLQDRLDAQGPFTWQAALPVGVKVASALASAHGLGVFHRDVKPANILVSAFGEPLLTDFGIARVAGSMETSSGVVTASVAHAPPEVLSGHRPTVSGDVWSLGSTLHMLVAGRAPFLRDDDDSMLAVYSRIAQAPPPDLRPLGVPDRLCSALEQAMAKDPAERFADVAALGAELQAVEASLGLPVTPLPVAHVTPVPTRAPIATGPPAGTVAPTTLVTPAGPWVPPATGRAVDRRRRRRALGLVAGIAVVAAAAVAFALATGGDDGTAEPPASDAPTITSAAGATVASTTAPETGATGDPASGSTVPDPPPDPAQAFVEVPGYSYEAVDAALLDQLRADLAALDPAGEHLVALDARAVAQDGAVVVNVLVYATRGEGRAQAFERQIVADLGDGAPERYQLGDRDVAFGPVGAGSTPALATFVDPYGVVILANTRAQAEAFAAAYLAVAG